MGAERGMTDDEWAGKIEAMRDDPEAWGEPLGLALAAGR